jgi:glutaredoxin
MKLNPLQAATLKRLQTYRYQNPNLFERVRLATTHLFILVIPFAAAGWLFIRLGFPAGVPLIGGMLLGAFAVEVGHQRKYVLWWPFNHAITDWNKVDQLARGEIELQPLASQSAHPPKTRVARAALIGVALFAVIFGGALATNRALAMAHDPTANNPPDNVIVLTAAWCGYCMELRRHLVEMNVHYTDLDVEKTTEGSWAYTAVRGTGIPITIVGREVIRGTGSVAGGRRWEKIDRALLKAGYDLPAR